MFDYNMKRNIIEFPGKWTLNKNIIDVKTCVYTTFLKTLPVLLATHSSGPFY